MGRRCVVATAFAHPSVPPRAERERLELWLAEVGRERIEETANPEPALDRALEAHLKKGYAGEWIHRRLRAIQAREGLPDKRQYRGVKSAPATARDRQDCADGSGFFMPKPNAQQFWSRCANIRPPRVASV